MKLHVNLISAVSIGLKDVLEHGQQADLVVERLLTTNKKWGSRDRKFIAENIYEIVRFRRLYEFCAEAKPGEEGYTLKLLATKLLLENEQPVQVDVAASMSRDRILELHAQAQAIPKVRESIPDWMDELGHAELAENWEKELAALNTLAKLSIRVNTLKARVHEVANMFKGQGIPCYQVNYAPTALVFETRKNYRNHIGYKNGFFEVQDVSSQLVAPFLEVQPGMRVIDACAGAGGKTLHLAALMSNNGKITAMDTNAHKLEALEKRAQRAGAKNIMLAEAEEANINMLQNKADRLLLDVPCSGTGVLRRKPDAKWSLSLKSIEDIKAVQAQLLERYSTMLKPGGLMVYSTCSILPGENQVQVVNFLEKHKGRFELIGEKRISPADSGFDGFYMAKMRKL